MRDSDPICLDLLMNKTQRLVVCSDEMMDVIETMTRQTWDAVYETKRVVKDTDTLLANWGTPVGFDSFDPLTGL